nr:MULTISPECIES: NTP transferase domain-containing protein [Myxococcaceae]
MVLAAGAGRRMGGPKAVLCVEGLPLVAQHVARLAEVGCSPVVVVVPPQVHGQVAQVLASWPYVRLVAAETASQAHTLAVAARELGPEPACERVVVTPVDLVPARVETLLALLGAVMGEVLCASPTYRGQGGHPVVLRAALLEAYLGAGEPPPLRDVLEAAEQGRVRLEVEDPAVARDFDTAEELLRATGRGPTFWARRVR